MFWERFCNVDLVPSVSPVVVVVDDDAVPRQEQKQDQAFVVVDDCRLWRLFSTEPKGGLWCYPPRRKYVVYGYL